MSQPQIAGSLSLVLDEAIVIKYTYTKSNNFIVKGCARLIEDFLITPSTKFTETENFLNKLKNTLHTNHLLYCNKIRLAKDRHRFNQRSRGQILGPRLMSKCMHAQMTEKEITDCVYAMGANRVACFTVNLVFLTINDIY